MIRRAFAWLFGPVMRGAPPPAGARVRLVTYHPTVPLGTEGLVLRHCPPGRGVVVAWKSGDITVSFAAEVMILE